MTHAAGMNLVYQIVKVCYVYPRNEFYELLQLQNTEEPHEAKYDWLLMKGMYGEGGNIKTDIQIENEETLHLLHPYNSFDKKSLYINKLPETRNEIIINDKIKANIFHHFLCNEVLPGTTDYPPLIIMTYLKSYTSVDDVIDLWFNEENKLMAFTLRIKKKNKT